MPLRTTKSCSILFDQISFKTTEDLMIKTAKTVPFCYLTFNMYGFPKTPLILKFYGRHNIIVLNLVHIEEE